MRFLNATDAQKELTYQDVFLVPQYSTVTSRMHADLCPSGVSGMTLPVVVANMTAVAGRRMAETVARRGGLVVLPQDIPMERIERIVRYVKSCHHIFETPVVIDSDESIQTALNLIYKRAHGAAIIIDGERKPVGVFTVKDAHMRDKFNALEGVMTRDIISVPTYATTEDIFTVLHDKRLSIAPVVNSDGTLAGVMTKKGVLRSAIFKPAFNNQKELLTSVAVGINQDLEHKVSRLMEIGVDVIVLDTAHGHQEKMMHAISRVRALIGPHRPLAAGNIVTAQAAKQFIEAGASILKVGVGPGAMCTTRMMTGMGRPQFSAVREVSGIARSHGVHVWADGGVKHPRDIALALAAGADCAMIGSWFAGTYESPADIQRDERGRMYKENFGMASRRAVKNRNEGREAYTRAQKEYFEEGISQSKIYLDNTKGSVEDILDQISAGLRSSFTYAGAKNISEFYKNAVIGVQTQAGYAEGRAKREM
jgi:IMP dehydrogenase